MHGFQLTERYGAHDLWTVPACREASGDSRGWEYHEQNLVKLHGEVRDFWRTSIRGREKARGNVGIDKRKLTPAERSKRTETARGPKLEEAEMHSVNKRKRDSSTGSTSGFGEKRVRFEPSTRIIPDAWFAVLVEGARFSSREAEEEIKSQLLGRMIQDAAFWEGERESMKGAKSEANKETECEPTVEEESSEEEETIEKTPAEVQLVMRRQWVVKVKNRWRAFAGRKARAVKVKTRRPVLRPTRVRHQAPREVPEPVTETQETTPRPAIRRYLSLTIEGKEYSALLDSGATRSLAEQPLVEQFSDRLKSSNSRVQAVNKKGNKMMGVLPVMLEVDERSEFIKFKAVDDAEQQILLYQGVFIGKTGWRSEGHPGGLLSIMGASSTIRAWLSSSSATVPTAPYHHRAIRTERCNRTLKRIIAMFVKKDQMEWDIHIHEMRNAVNTATHAST